MKKLKKILKFYFPEILILLGVAVVWLSANASDSNCKYGGYEPDWVVWVMLIGLAIAFIGVFLSKVRENALIRCKSQAARRSGRWRITK